MKRVYNREEQKQHREELVAALRSGDYDQTTGTLRRTPRPVDRRPEGYCCLGVACDLSGLGKWKSHRAETFDGPAIEWEFFDVSSEVGDAAMTDEVTEYYGFSNGCGAWKKLLMYEGRSCKSLMSLNDAGAPFSRIAAVIEEEPEGLIA